jgi:OmpA-OmpF porin, OOP family
VILVYFFLIMIFQAGAQQRISLAGGLHSSSVSPYWKIQPGASSQLMQGKGGFHLGLIADLPIRRFWGWYFQPGVLYNNKGAKQQQAFDPYLSKLSYYSYSQNIKYFDVPLNLVYKFSSSTNTRFIAGGGPYGSFHYQGNESINSLDTLGNITYDSNRDLPVGSGDGEFRVLHWGFNLVAGLEFRNAYLTANYSKGLTPYFTQGENKYKYGTIGVTLGFFLSGPKEENRNAKDRIYYCPDWW